jgi:membrane protein DedA with SNARE-associated domain
VETLLLQLKPYLDHYGYWAVFGAVLLEDFGVPLPGESMLIVGSLLAAQGVVHIVPLLLVAWAGAVLGDNVGYLIGRYGGRRLVLRYGHYVFLTPQRLERVEGFFQRHGGSVVIVARFIEGLRQFNGIAAGIARMRWTRFLLYNAAGAILWAGSWGMLFYELGERATKFAELFKKMEYFLIALFVITCAGLLIYLVRKRRGEK